MSVWFGGGDVQVQLAAEYRKAAQTSGGGDYRQATFIYGKLLRDFRLAADVLSRGGLHPRRGSPLSRQGWPTRWPPPARSRLPASSTGRLQLYRQREEHLLAAALLRKTGEEEAAIEEFKLAADQIVRKQQNHLAAGELLHEQAGRTDLAAGLLAPGLGLSGRCR